MTKLDFDEIRKKLLEDKAEIHTGTPVKQIIIKNRTAVGVELEDGSIENADYVIINTDFAHAMTHIINPKDLRKWTINKVDSRRHSCSTFMLYLGVNKIYDHIPHHNIIFSDDYRKYVEDMTTRMTVSAPRGVHPAYSLAKQCALPVQRS